MKSMSNYEFFIALVQTNFINILKRKDYDALSELKTNPRQLSDLMMSLGANESIMMTPAHREVIEGALVEIIDDLKDAMQHGKGDVGYDVNFQENGELSVKIESFATQDDYKIKMDDDKYSISKITKRSSLGYKDKEIQGNLDTRQIIIYETSSNMSEEVEKGQKIILDENGFAIEEQSVNKTKKIGAESEENKTTSKLTRDGIKITVPDAKSVRWNGDPIHLNNKNASSREIQRNVVKTIRKYPNTQKYYEDILGIDLSDALREDK